MIKFPPINEQMDLVGRGVDELISEEQLEQKLESASKSGEPLIVKLGCDPSRPDLHIGHAVVLRKLRHFQDLGHQAVLVIGDFTAMIGDPSGRNKTRPQLTIQEAKEYGLTYVEQASAVLDVGALNIFHNSDWLSAMNFDDVIRLTSHYTVARMLERDDFEKRYKSEVPISLHEFLYPLAQAMDSVKLNADVELGGTDQKFNLLVGRDLQRAYDQNPQVVITTPLIEGTDGVKKMSKSYDNAIGLTDEPGDMYGKTLSIPDELIVPYFELATNISSKELDRIKFRLQKGENPRDMKRQLARDIVTLYHSLEAAQDAESDFDRIFVEGDEPEEIDEFIVKKSPVTVLTVMHNAGLVSSKREGRRLIEQGGVKVDGEKISDINTEIVVDQPRILRVGKRKFLKLVT
jgi:tyrosyl-tRNA synthetase